MFNYRVDNSQKYGFNNVFKAFFKQSNRNSQMEHSGRLDSGCRLSYPFSRLDSGCRLSYPFSETTRLEVLGCSKLVWNQKIG